MCVCVENDERASKRANKRASEEAYMRARADLCTHPDGERGSARARVCVCVCVRVCAFMCALQWGDMPTILSKC